MQPSKIAWTVCLLPLFCVHASWIWSSSVGAIPWCLPYWDGCASISRAARSSDALFLFRAGMILSAAWLIMYWRLCSHFLQRWKFAQRSLAMLILGYLGAMFLVLYADFLGTEGTVYRLMRRYGVIFFFTFTVLAQYFFTRDLLRNKSQLKAVYRHLQTMLGLGLFILIIGFISLGATILLDNPEKDRWENVTEWWFALAMMAYFGVTALMWKKLRYQIN